MILCNQPICPYNKKWQLVEWAVKYFNQPKSKFNRMKKKQLYAIWYRVANERIIK